MGEPCASASPAPFRERRKRMRIRIFGLLFPTIPSFPFRFFDSFAKSAHRLLLFSVKT